MKTPVINWHVPNANWRIPQRGPRKGKAQVELKVVGELPDGFHSGGYERLMALLQNAGDQVTITLNAHKP
jgi:hypothetical protein